MESDYCKNLLEIFHGCVCGNEKMSYFCELFQWNVTLKAQMKGIYQSGQMGQTVNLLVNAYGGSNPSVPTFIY